MGCENTPSVDQDELIAKIGEYQVYHNPPGVFEVKGKLKEFAKISDFKKTNGMKGKTDDTYIIEGTVNILFNDGPYYFDPMLGATFTDNYANSSSKFSAGEAKVFRVDVYYQKTENGWRIESCPLDLIQ